ncbi:uncharacterized protein [Haliotis cracherodii]|uniref:uncharacterized protein isoform X1 n=2 Tax=Haliotis cracherodii TaxID=6455 RepID=UPI0039E88E53
MGLDMQILLKLCVSVWVLVLDAGAQVDICGSGPVLVANSTPQTLQNTDGLSSQCTVQITVPAGSSLKLDFTRFNSSADSIELFANDSSVNGVWFAAVNVNALNGRGAPTYVYHGSVYIRVNFLFANSTFVMTYQEVDFEENICTLPSLVPADTTVQEVVTPNFGNGPYFDNADCEVMIKSSITGAREVKVEVMSSHFECCCDGVRICDDDGCLNLCYTSKRIFHGSSVSIRHWSDYSWGYTGTRLEYTILLTGLRGRATPVTVTVPPNNALSTTLEQGLASRTAALARLTRNEPVSAEPRVRIASSGISSGLREFKE